MRPENKRMQEFLRANGIIERLEAENERLREAAKLCLDDWDRQFVKRNRDQTILCPHCGDLLSPWSWVELNGRRGGELYYCQICGVAVSHKKEEVNS